MNINGSTTVLGIFGNPIKHTFSPDIHNYLSKKLELNNIYVPFPVTDIEDAVKGAFSMGIKGLNVTVPFKEAVMPFLSLIDEDAKRIGAVNTLVRTDKGFKGFNTDMPGLGRALRSYNEALEGKNVIILGAGGAARAVAYLAQKENASSIYLVNRTFDKAKNLCDEINELFGNEKIVPVAAAEYSLIPKAEYTMIQCTSLGLNINDGLLIEDDSFYEMASYGYDLIYNPCVTPFIDKLKRKGIKADNGLKMLTYQAIIAYELWNDIKVDDKYADLIYNELAKKIYGPNIILIGYMGSGKSSVAKALADKYQMSFIDTDEYIVKKEGMSINEIFIRFGEDTFRKMETEALKEIAASANDTVIATGGGTILKRENVDILRETGRIYYLMASPEEIYNRVQYDTSRPLLKAKSPEEVKKKIDDMLKQRKGYYEMASDKMLVTDGVTVEKLAEKIYSDMIAKN